MITPEADCMPPTIHCHNCGQDHPAGVCLAAFDATLQNTVRATFVAMLHLQKGRPMPTEVLDFLRANWCLHCGDPDPGCPCMNDD